MVHGEHAGGVVHCCGFGTIVINQTLYILLFGYHGYSDVSQIHHMHHAHLITFLAVMYMYLLITITANLITLHAAVLCD